jgi:hypothetical protein
MRATAVANATMESAPHADADCFGLAGPEMNWTAPADGLPRPYAGPGPFLAAQENARREPEAFNSPAFQWGFFASPIRCFPRACARRPGRTVLKDVVTPCSNDRAQYTL